MTQDGQSSAQATCESSSLPFLTLTHSQSQEVVEAEIRGLSIYSSGLKQRSLDLFDSLPVGDSVFVRKGDEVAFSYHAHSDDELLAEYGFALGFDRNPDNLLDVTFDVEELYNGLEGNVKQQKLALLEQHDYRGNYHLVRDSEGVIQPSFRTTVALELLCFDPEKQKDDRDSKHKRQKTEFSAISEAVAPFKSLVEGHRDTLSEENNRRCQKRLRDICDMMSQRAQTALANLDDLKISHPQSDILEYVRVLHQSDVMFCDQWTKLAGYEQKH